MNINKNSILICIYSVYDFQKGRKYKIRRLHESGAITVYTNLFAFTTETQGYSLFSNQRQLEKYFKVDIQEIRKQKLQKINND